MKYSLVVDPDVVLALAEVEISELMDLEVVGCSLVPGSERGEREFSLSLDLWMSVLVVGWLWLSLDYEKFASSTTRLNVRHFIREVTYLAVSAQGWASRFSL